MPCVCNPDAKLPQDFKVLASVEETAMKGKRPELKDAIEALQHELIHDTEYRDAWKANIAMAIYDTRKPNGETAHKWRQRCAEQAIKFICAGHPDDPTSQFMEAIGH